MALAKTIKFSDFVLTIGDGATPTEVFAAPCAFNARSFVRNKTFNEVIIPDCADEDKAGWIYRDPTSVDWAVTGEGVMDEGSIPVWDEWFMESGSRNVKLTITTSTTPIVYSGNAHLQTLTYAANRGERVTFNVNIVSSGALAETPPVLTMSASLMEGAEEAAAAHKARRKKVPETAEAA